MGKDYFYISHYSRKGMKWGKNIFEDRMERLASARQSSRFNTNYSQQAKAAENSARYPQPRLIGETTGRVHLAKPSKVSEIRTKLPDKSGVSAAYVKPKNGEVYTLNNVDYSQQAKAAENRKRALDSSVHGEWVENINEKPTKEERNAFLNSDFSSKSISELTRMANEKIDEMLADLESSRNELNSAKKKAPEAYKRTNYIYKTLYGQSLDDILRSGKKPKLKLQTRGIKA